MQILVKQGYNQLHLNINNWSCTVVTTGVLPTPNSNEAIQMKQNLLCENSNYVKTFIKLVLLIFR